MARGAACGSEKQNKRNDSVARHASFILGRAVPLQQQNRNLTADIPVRRLRFVCTSKGYSQFTAVRHSHPEETGTFLEC
jgi:hypothetical protein